MKQTHATCSIIDRIDNEGGFYMSLPLGTIHSMLVDGQHEQGYLVTKGQFNGLLPEEETEETLQPGSLVQVFVYRNKQGHIALTAKLPQIVLGAYGWVEVVDIFPSLGVFVKISPTIDVLVPKDSMPYVHKAWPLPGDQLFITLTVDKQERLLGVLAKEDDFYDMVQFASTEIPLNTNVTGIIVRSEREGAVIYTEEQYRGFIHHTEMEKPVRLGEKVHGRIIEVKENGSINVSLKPMKHERLDDDAEKIYTYLEAADGVMPYGDKSDADAIRTTFGMSKSAFKRALGRLMKENRIEQRDGQTYKKKCSELNLSIFYILLSLGLSSCIYCRSNH